MGGAGGRGGGGGEGGDLTTNRYSQSSLAKFSPNNFSSKRIQFSMWFVINCTGNIRKTQNSFGDPKNLFKYDRLL